MKSYQKVQLPKKTRKYSQKQSYLSYHHILSCHNLYYCNHYFHILHQSLTGHILLQSHHHHLLCLHEHHLYLHDPLDLHLLKITENSSLKACLLVRDKGNTTSRAKYWQKLHFINARGGFLCLDHEMNLVKRPWFVNV